MFTVAKIRTFRDMAKKISNSPIKRGYCRTDGTALLRIRKSATSTSNSINQCLKICSKLIKTLSSPT